jgi:hypothetical protein
VAGNTDRTASFAATAALVAASCGGGGGSAESLALATGFCWGAIALAMIPFEAACDAGDFADADGGDATVA